MTGNVIFYNRFVTLEELTDFIGAADIYVTPYLNEAQITSGTLAYAFGAGKAVISTPYWYAQELLANDQGILVPFGDSAAIAVGVDRYLSDPTLMNATRKRAWKIGRAMIWPVVAQRYMESFERARASLSAPSRKAFAVRTLENRPYELPPLKLDHLLRMSDNTGIFQHAIFNVPNFAEGYCTDDNARAFILTLRLPEMTTRVGRLDIEQLASTYLAFLWDSFNKDTCRFRNLLTRLDKRFTLQELDQSIAQTTRDETLHQGRDVQRTLECMHWLAESNYQIHFGSSSAMSERIIFPVSPNESNGIEDARFVRFVDDDNSVTYYATYTAYNGRVILPQLIETTDFFNFRVLTQNGQAVQNKGMALFPRRINGRYAMLSRQDDENLFLMFSDHPHFWSDPQLLQGATLPWEIVKLGNCGSPIETEAGWLVITHGVGPVRKYSMGAILLDLHDPSKVIGRLHEPLLKPEGAGREGYVPNVVDSCGALIHRGRLILPYGLSDSASTIVAMELSGILAGMVK